MHMKRSNLLQNACEYLLKNDLDFWLLAGLTDCSFETGGSWKFRRAIDSMRDAGFGTERIDCLRRGINGNLEAVLEREHSLCVRANRGRGGTRPDICFERPTDGVETVAEVKVVLDVTIPQYYGHKDRHGIADDRDKLLKLRRAGFDGRLLQVVFFLEMPNYYYPAGRSFAPDWKPHGSRDSYPGHRGINTQYRELQKHLRDAPAWPTSGPYLHALAPSAKKTIALVDKWYSMVFRPKDASWKFRASDQLAEATVGCVIWEY
jgi:hypothetical protein